MPLLRQKTALSIKMTGLTMVVSSWRLSLLVVQVVVLLLPNSWLKTPICRRIKLLREKRKNFFLALELTKKYSKDQILTMYLNNAYFGNGVWGVEDASKKYFGVSASEVSLDQAATLAGMLKGPELYNPLNSVQDSTNRRGHCLTKYACSGLH